MWEFQKGFDVPSHVSTFGAPTVMDACCAINIAASGVASDILSTIEPPVKVVDFVLRVELRSMGSMPNLIRAGLVEVVTATEDEEAEALYFLSDAFIDDGKAITGAIAQARGWIVLTDEAAATSLFTRQSIPIPVLSTPHILKHWSDAKVRGEAAVRTVLRAVEVVGRYRPHVTHPLRDWWDRHW